MDISKLCTTGPVEEVEVLPSPQSTHNQYGQKLTSIAAITDQNQVVLPPIPDQYNYNTSSSSNVHAPKIRYPQITNNNNNNEPHSLVNSLSIHDLKQSSSDTMTQPPSSSYSDDIKNNNNGNSKRQYSDNDNQTPQQQQQQSNQYVPKINITDIISQCSRLCENLDRCKGQSQNELDRHDLLQSASQTARDILSSLGSLQEQQKNRHRSIMEEGSNTFIHSSNSTTETESPENVLLRRSRSDSDGSIRPRIKRRAKRSTAGQRCHSCHTTETPEWRRGPDGARTLCNACGLHYAKLLRKGSLTVQTQGFLIENGGSGNGMIGNTLTNNSNSSNNNNNNNNNGITTQQQQQKRRQPRIIQYPIIQVQAKPYTDSPSSSNRVKFVNSEITYPRDEKWRICANTPTATPTQSIPDTSPYITNRTVEIEEE
ncbi:hypothetical protein BDA99DRAFT_607664 [Phascolomyces articulosus]|uniref:GATA-type domain-containing protein n=1 Tax=Phascolomyces articulosus TaxID=60185 RepID=A0AAD5JSQ6_9FUNG|nr:hypothetical protein BDA99DRAFT_607664 [Phascolomyces articulosus]